MPFLREELLKVIPEKMIIANPKIIMLFEKRNSFLNANDCLNFFFIHLGAEVLFTIKYKYFYVKVFAQEISSQIMVEVNITTITKICTVICGVLIFIMAINRFVSFNLSSPQQVILSAIYM